MTVLDGDVSQWNRSAIESRAIGPADGSPAAIRSIAARWGRIVAGSASGAIARSRASSSDTRAARNFRGRLRTMTPAFSDSPRSTRGTTRTAEYWNWSFDASGGSATVGLPGERVARGEPRAQVRDVRAALGVRVAGPRVGREPRGRDRGDELLEQGRRHQPRQPLRRRGHGAGERQQDVLAAALERS